MMFPRTIGVLLLLLVPTLGLGKDKAANSGSTAAATKAETGPQHTLSQLTIKVKDAGVRVTLNGKAIGQTPLAGPWTVKPGEHVLSFTAKGKPSGEVKLSVKAGESRVVEWPEPAADVSDESSSLNWAPWSLSDVGLGVAVGGVVAIALGGYFGSQAVDLAGEAGRMVTTETFRVDFERLTQQSSDAALAANLSYGIGAAALMSGIVMAVFGDGGIMSLEGDEDEAVIIIGGSF